MKLCCVYVRRFPQAHEKAEKGNDVRFFWDDPPPHFSLFSFIFFFYSCRELGQCILLLPLTIQTMTFYMLWRLLQHKHFAFYHVQNYMTVH